jgi:tRNA uridine 5-carboxymethylaminomethyl modification enzyme
MGISDDALIGAFPELGELDRRILDQLRNDAVYAPYVERQNKEMARLRKDEVIVIPRGFDYGRVTGLSNELRNKLIQKRPETLAQASVMEGMTPAAVTLLYAHLRNLPQDWLGRA